MKKIYAFLTLFLLSFVSNHAQTILSDYHTCDDDNDGISIFDLTSKTDEMLFVLNTAEYNFSYYRSLSDAQGNVNPIATPNFYLNTVNPQQIVARATNVQTLENFYFYFVLNVDAPPMVLGPASLTFCSETELPIFNLYDAVPQLVGDQAGLTFTFFDQATGNFIDPNDVFNFVPTSVPVQIIDVMIENQCPQVVLSSITLHTNDCTPPQPCPPPSVLSVSNVTETTVRLSWTSQPAAYYQIYVTPIGAPAPLPTTAATAVVQAAPFTMTGLVPDACYAFYVRSGCNPLGTSNFSDWIGPFNFCTVPYCENNGACPDHLALVSFLDANNNGIKDTGEMSFDAGIFNYVIDNSAEVLHGYSNNGNPFRIFDSNSNHSYDLSYSVNPELAAYFSCATTHNDIQITPGSGSHTYYFPIVQTQPFQDLAVEIVPSGSPRPGFPYTNYVTFKNKGFGSIPSGTITFTKADAVSVLSISESGAIANATGFTFSFSNLLPGQAQTIQVVMQVPTIPTVALGQLLTSSATIEPVAEDAYPTNNTATLTLAIVGSYDPNDKTEAHGGKVAMDTFTTEDYLTYTIQFENTGTASAEFIHVEDLLNAGLNPDTVEMVSASHPYNMRRIGNKLVWNFYNINLPTTTSNPSQSHGYIQFRVKPTAGYAVGTMIPNAADIYFDYNPAIVTDTFETYFVETLGNNVFANNTFYMAPNPANSIVHLGWKDTNDSFEKIEIRDVLGKLMASIRTNSNEASIDVSQFAKGIYLVELTSKIHSKTTKKLIVD